MTRTLAPLRGLGGLACFGSLLALLPALQTQRPPKDPVNSTGSFVLGPGTSGSARPAVQPWREPLHWAEVGNYETGVPIPLRQEIAAVHQAWGEGESQPLLRRARVPDRGRLGRLELWWLSGVLGGDLRSVLWLRDADTGERTTRPADLRSQDAGFESHQLWMGDLELDGELELVLRVQQPDGLLSRESFLAVEEDLNLFEELVWAPQVVEPRLAENYRWMLRRELQPTGSQGLIATTWLVDLDGARRALPCAVADLLRSEREGGSGAFELAGVDWAPGFELERFVATGSALLERGARDFGDPLPRVGH